MPVPCEGRPIAGRMRQPGPACRHPAGVYPAGSTECNLVDAIAHVTKEAVTMTSQLPSHSRRFRTADTSAQTAIRHPRVWTP